MASLYQNAGPPGTYRQNQGPPPPPPPSQYPTSTAYNYANTQTSNYGANMGPHSQMAYNPSYGYGGSNASYGPPGVANQNQYPPLPPYSIPSQPPPPPPPPLSAAPPPPPPPPLPPMSSVQPPPPPPLQPTSHHGVAYVPPNTNSTNQGYQEGIHSAYYPSAHSTQLPPPPPPPSSYVSSSQAPSALHSGTGLSMQTGSAPAASSRQNTIQASASTWLSSGEASKTTLKPSSALKPGAANALDKVPGASRVPSASKPPPTKADNRIESDRELRERKRREYERRKLEEKKEVKMHSGQAMQKFPPAGTPLAKYNSGINLRDGRTDRKDKVDNRLKRPSTFVCKIKFRNELPDPVSQPKLLQVNSDRDRYSKYSITSLEKTQKHRLLVDSDLGVPLDLLDISIYNAPKVRPPMDPEDEELLRDDEKLPSAKTDSIRKKDRPTDKGVAWLVKTQYISSINLDPAKQALTEKQAKEQKEIREGKRDFLESLNDREHQIRSIQESFRVAQQVPVHQTKPHLQPVEVFPLLPDFNRQSSRLTHVTFDGEPTADSELHNKLEQAVRDELEALAILKTYNLSDAETGRQERFLAYMVPKVEELNSDYMNEMSYTWMREYHMEARPEETQNFSSYVFSFGEDSVQYLPLQQKISLRKKKAKERSKEDFESTFAVPSSVTVRRGEEDQAGDDEDGSGRSAHRQSRAEGIPHGESRNSHGLKRRQSSDDGEFTRMPKRKEVNRDMSDDDEDGYM